MNSRWAGKTSCWAAVFMCEMIKSCRVSSSFSMLSNVITTKATNAPLRLNLSGSFLVVDRSGRFEFIGENTRLALSMVFWLRARQEGGGEHGGADGAVIFISLKDVGGAVAGVGGRNL